ncbi:unnamed protein product [Leptidea sinapis]|uniref:Seminal fluid protein n=1 Tax=Leptidea sinapis TaxID=189913 RepID=A0A5E4PK57_9NEOP|nr:unnamed protein product [Leptidea sinapis]
MMQWITISVLIISYCLDIRGESASENNHCGRGDCTKKPPLILIPVIIKLFRYPKLYNKEHQSDTQVLKK